MEALHDIVKAGYARYIGMSSCFAWQCEFPLSPRAWSKIPEPPAFARCSPQDAELRSCPRLNGIHNLYNPVYREEEREMIPLLKDLGVGMINWSPNAGGYLARPYGNQTERGGTDQ